MEHTEKKNSIADYDEITTKKLEPGAYDPDGNWRMGHNSGFSNKGSSTGPNGKPAGGNGLKEYWLLWSKRLHGTKTG